MATRFTHPPLPNEGGRIRLLQVSLTDGPPGEKPRLRGRFEVVALDDERPPFLAISYAWGDAKPVDKIWFNSARYLDLTSSASELLRHLAACGTSLYFWIDAVCINQDDKAEKASQIDLMHQVYSQAEEVLAWVGEEDDDGELAFRFLGILRQAIRTLMRSKLPLNLKNLTSRPGCEWPSPSWQALSSFLQRPFFRRVWIIQEMVNSSKTVLWCGGWQCDWEQFAAIGNILRRNSVGYLLSGDEGMLGVEALGTTFDLRRMIKTGIWVASLATILLGCLVFESTDPRDRIFALRQISIEANDPALRSDYDQTVEEVFIH